MKEYRLSVEELSQEYDLSNLEFRTTAEIEPLQELVGQDAAIDTIDFALDIDHPGYNIFVTNFSGQRQMEYIRELVATKAKESQEELSDWCYVYNYDNPDYPLYLKLPVGLGKIFKDDVERIITQIRNRLHQFFNSEKYLEQKKEIKSVYQQSSNKLFKDIREEVEGLGYILEKESSGFSVIPMKEDNEAMSEEEYNELSFAERKTIEDDTARIQDMLDSVLTKIDKLNDEYEEKVEDLDISLATSILEKDLSYLEQKYDQYEPIGNYLTGIGNEILENLDNFKEDEEAQQMLVLFQEDKSEEDSSKYKVNLLVDNSYQDGPPAIIEHNPTYYNLMGRVEYSNSSGNLITDFNHIKAGSLLQANQGYLILEAKEVLNNFKAWQLLKRVLKSQKLRMENIGEDFEKLPLSTLEPEAIPMDIKVIMIGDVNLYYMLYRYDKDFKDLFKVKAAFKVEMDNNLENLNKIIRFISHEVHNHNLRHLDKSAVAELIRFLARKVENQNKFTTKLNLITEILYEADNWAQRSGSELITKEEIDQAITQRDNRLSNYENKLQELYKKHKILIDTTGFRIGQVNALAVLDLGEYTFGKVVKITATVYQGSSGVINIERESKLSGNIHNKGVLILSSYLGSKYAQQIPLSFSANLCFEQSYSGVDGDSASSAELYALLSALAQIPLKQNIAVTGSINQKGEIQPIGGVNEKIEGFFKVCQQRGLTGQEAVIIPIQNVENLMLSDQVIKAVAEDKFNIYAISSIEEGMEILTGLDMGEKAEGEYPINTINHAIQQRIREFFKNANQN